MWVDKLEPIWQNRMEHNVVSTSEGIIGLRRILPLPTINNEINPLMCLSTTIKANLHTNPTDPWPIPKKKPPKSLLKNPPTQLDWTYAQNNHYPRMLACQSFEPLNLLARNIQAKPYTIEEPCDSPNLSLTRTPSTYQILQITGVSPILTRMSLKRKCEEKEEDRSPGKRMRLELDEPEQNSEGGEVAVGE